MSKPREYRCASIMNHDIHPDDAELFQLDIVEYNLPQSMIGYTLIVESEDVGEAIEIAEMESSRNAVNTMQVVAARKWTGSKEKFSVAYDDIRWVQLDIPKTLNELQAYQTVA